MKYQFTALALVAAIGADAAVLRSELKSIPNGWTQASTPADSQTISLTVALQQQNEDAFYSKLNEISNPQHASYGKWLEKDAVNSMLKPSAASKTAVVSWLKANGVKNIQSDDFNIKFATDIGTANKLLSAKYQNFHQEGINKIRTLSYSVPDNLDQHIAVVSPTTYLGKPISSRVVFGESHNQQAKVLVNAAADNCSAGLTPSCIKNYYNIKYTPSKKTKATMAFASFLNQSAQYSDLAAYEAKNGLAPQNFTTVLINGGVDDQTKPNDNAGEANLDAQNMVAVGQPIPLTQFITGGSPPFIPGIDLETNTNEPWLDYLEFLLSKDNKDIPQVISHSYGDEEVTVPRDYAKKVCNGFAQLGARGITALSSSGDTGVGAGCKTANNQTRFNAQFPTSCPYITSIGGTSIPRANLTLAFDNEGAWSGSSGGFSDFFSRPLYQELAVERYLKYYAGNKTKAYAPYTNFSGRGYPDVSAFAGLPGYPIIDNGEQGLTGGTSASSPVWGAIVALLNDARLKQGKRSMGFINPFLYTLGQVGLRDITIRAAVGCNGVNTQTGAPVEGGGIVPGAAWNATVGWDPVTGLGVPNFQKLLAVATLLP